MLAGFGLPEPSARLLLALLFGELDGDHRVMFYYKPVCCSCRFTAFVLATVFRLVIVRLDAQVQVGSRIYA